MGTDTDREIKSALDHLTGEFSRVAIECSEVLFGWKADIRNPWTVTDTPQGTFDYIFMLESRNTRFLSTMVIGVGRTSLQGLWGGVTLDEAKDAFGEFGNVYCAMVQDISAFQRAFGFLRQTPPEDAVKEVYFPRAWALHGMIHVKSHELYMAYQMRRSLFDIDILDPAPGAPIPSFIDS